MRTLHSNCVLKPLLCRFGFIFEFVFLLDSKSLVTVLLQTETGIYLYFSAFILPSASMGCQASCKDACPQHDAATASLHSEEDVLILVQCLCNCQKSKLTDLQLCFVVSLRSSREYSSALEVILTSPDWNVSVTLS